MSEPDPLSEQCERCGNPLVADAPNGYESTFCGVCELDIEDEDEPWRDDG